MSMRNGIRYHDQTVFMEASYGLLKIAFTQSAGGELLARRLDGQRQSGSMSYCTSGCCPA